MIDQNVSVEELANRAGEAADLLKLLANDVRLMLLCRLRQGEASAGELVDLVGQSQSSVSQHLAKFRSSGIVATRRDAQTIYYRLASPRVEALIDTLCDSFGPE